MTDDLRELKRRLDEAHSKATADEWRNYNANRVYFDLMRDAWPAISAALDRAVVERDKAIKTLVDMGFCTHYPGFTCDEDFPAACPECIREWLPTRAQAVAAMEPVTCPECMGENPQECPECGGAGEISTQPRMTYDEAKARIEAAQKGAK
jgi:hypothetical protein